MEVSKQLHTPAAFTPEKEYGSDTWTVKARDAKRITTGDEIHEKNSRIHSDRLQNKYINCKEIKNNTNFGQITGIQEKLDTTCK